MPSRDYFAELYVAGLFGDCGWAVYFPKRDVGFDFIISKQVDELMILRPVQVKGKFPEIGRTEGRVYGFIGELTARHPDMVLAIPYFSTDAFEAAPSCIAFMPDWQIRPQASRGSSCCPAVYRDAKSEPRASFVSYFNRPGIQLLEDIGWSIPKLVEDDEQTEQGAAANP
jgi:hypothetical protein